MAKEIEKVLHEIEESSKALIKNVKQYKRALMKIADCHDQANPIHLKDIARKALINVAVRADEEIRMDWVSPSDPGDENE